MVLINNLYDFPWLREQHIIIDSQIPTILN